MLKGLRWLDAVISDKRVTVLHAILITGIAFGFNFLWEMIQCSRFFIHLDRKATASAMLMATFGDVAMTWFAQIIVAAVSKRWLWLLGNWTWQQWTPLVGTALGLSSLVEYWALSSARWAYTDINPQIPGTSFSVLPVAQLVLLFPLTFGLSRLFIRGVRNRSTK